MGFTCAWHWPQVAGCHLIDRRLPHPDVLKVIDRHDICQPFRSSMPRSSKTASRRWRSPLKLRQARVYPPRRTVFFDEVPPLFADRGGEDGIVGKRRALLPTVAEQAQSIDRKRLDQPASR